MSMANQKYECPVDYYPVCQSVELWSFDDLELEAEISNCLEQKSEARK